ncbi:MAG: phospholipase [Pirellulales bacterium]|nr:phospholipase [Pirellulales bacterium]
MSAPTVSTEILRTLHRLHRQLTDLRERLARGPKQIAAAESNLAARQSLLEKAKAEEKAFRMHLDAKQLQLKTSEARIGEFQIKRNAAQSNREYQTFTEQIGAAEMANSVLEDEILEAMEKAQEYKDKIAQAEAELAAARQKLDEIRAKVAEQEPRLTADMTRLEAELKRAEEDLPPEIRDPYRRVVKHLGEDALAPLENQYCGGCNQQITLNVYSQIMMNQPAFCKTCGRLLYQKEGK